MPQHLVAAAAAVRRRTEQHLVLSASVRPKYRARRHVRTRLQDIVTQQGISPDKANDMNARLNGNFESAEDFIAFLQSQQ